MGVFPQTKNQNTHAMSPSVYINIVHENEKYQEL